MGSFSLLGMSLCINGLKKLVVVNELVLSSVASTFFPFNPVSESVILNSTFERLFEKICD